MRTTMVRAKKAVLALAVLAAASSCLIAGTALNYMGAARAAAGFSASVSILSLQEVGGRPTVRLVLSLSNDSSWRLEVVAAHVSVFLGGQYIWGENFDWLGDPVVLGEGEEKAIPLDVRVPPEKIPTEANGGTWAARVNGLVDMPMLGRKAFRCYGSSAVADETKEQP